MKVVVEKVPEGVKVSLTPDAAKKPVVVTLRPGEISMLTQIIDTAMRSESFKFEYQV